MQFMGIIILYVLSASPSASAPVQGAPCVHRVQARDGHGGGERAPPVRNPESSAPLEWRAARVVRAGCRPGPGASRAVAAVRAAHMHNIIHMPLNIGTASHVTHVSRSLYTKQ